MNDFHTAQRIEYGGWPNCYRLANNEVDLIITTDVGPRIIRFGFLNERNEFKEYPEMLGKTGGDEWRIYGGHRLWHAPEVESRTYYPDNEPVEFQQHENFVRVIQPTETTTNLQKEMDISLHPQHAQAQITHRLTNRGVWNIEFAPWSSSVLAPGGIGFFPLPPRGKHPDDLIPTSSLTLWSFINLSDPRWKFGFRHIMLRQDENIVAPQKIGASVPDGWAAYARDNHLFVKTFAYQLGAEYADLGANFEMFTNGEMLELETLAPLISLPPGESIEHIENWFLLRDVPTPQNESDIETHILPRLAPLLETR